MASAAAVAVVATLAWGATGVLRRPDGDRTAAVAAATTPDPTVSATRDASASAPDPSASAPDAPAVQAPAPSPTFSAPSAFPVPSSPSPSLPIASGTPTPTGTSSAAQVAGAVATLPVYLVGAVGNEGSGLRYGLFRQFVSATVPGDATAAQKAQVALSAALESRTGGGASPYLRPWAGTTVEHVTLSDQLVTIGLSGGGAAGVPAEQSRLAVQQLVWTATPPSAAPACRSASRWPTGRPPCSAPTRPTRPTPRPAADATYQDLAPIWVEGPATGTTVPRRPDGRGQRHRRRSFEANVQWRLTRSGAEVTKGFTTASTGAPGARHRGRSTSAGSPPGPTRSPRSPRSAEDGRVHGQRRGAPSPSADALGHGLQPLTERARAAQAAVPRQQRPAQARRQRQPHHHTCAPRRAATRRTSSGSRSTRGPARSAARPTGWPSARATRRAATSWDVDRLHPHPRHDQQPAPPGRSRVWRAKPCPTRWEAHHGVDLAGADHEVDAVEDLLAVDPGAQPFDHQLSMGGPFRWCIGSIGHDRFECRRTTSPSSTHAPGSTGRAGWPGRHRADR